MAHELFEQLHEHGVVLRSGTALPSPGMARAVRLETALGAWP
jgi:hypothetical protein